MIPKHFFRIIEFEECSENTHFPSTHAFNEGWMLCLIFDAIQNLSLNNELRFLARCRGHSEARLDSRFQPATQSDPLGEGQTHADGVIGDLDFREETRTGLRLTPQTSRPLLASTITFPRSSWRTTQVSGAIPVLAVPSRIGHLEICPTDYDPRAPWTFLRG